MSKIHETWIVEFLNKNKETSYIGSELKVKLLEAYPDLTEANARKLISNCLKQNRIKSTSPVKFGKNEYVYYSVKAENEFELLKDNIKKYKPKLHRAFFALTRNRGILSYNELCKITGAYENNLLHDVCIKDVLNDLKFFNIAELKEYKGIKFIEFKNRSCDEQTLIHFTEDLKDKNLLLYQSLLWLSRSNIVGSNMQLFFGEDNKFNGISRNDTIWDAFCYTNTVGLGSAHKNFQTIVVVDFSIKHQYEEYDFLGFKNRVEHLLFGVKKEHRKVLPIIIAPAFSPAAKALIRKNNYMCFDLNLILGKNAVIISRTYRKAVHEIENHIYENKVDEIQFNVENFCAYLREDGSEDNYQNLKGDLFEYLMFPVFTKIFDKKTDNIIHGFSGSVNGEKFECDYRIETATENVFVELKGYKKDYVIPLGEYDSQKKKIASNQCVKWFLSNTYENAKRYVGTERKAAFCYITTAHIEKKAKEVLVSRKKDKAEILEPYYERETLLALLNKYNCEREAKIIEQYYI